MATKTKPQPEIGNFALTVVRIEPDKNIPPELYSELTGAFLPIYKQMQDMEADFEAITGADVTVHTHKISKQARELRLKYVALRGVKGLKGVHEKHKEHYRNVGNAIDALEREGRLAAQAREEKLMEIEKFQERQLQAEREDVLAPYLFEGQAMRTDLGAMNEDDWEIVFMGQRAKFQEAAEKEAKRVLRLSRIEGAARYALYIEDFDNIQWEVLTETTYNGLLKEAKDAHDEREAARVRAEAEAKRLQAEAAEREAEHRREMLRQAEEEAERQRKFSSRMASIKGSELLEDGIYYKGKRISTLKSIHEKPDEEFGAFLSKHLERYNADVQAEAEQRAKDEAARKAQMEEAARVAAENARLQAEKDAIERKRREDEERIAAQAAEAEAKKGAPDREKLQMFREELAGLGYPDCSSDSGRVIVENLQKHIAKAIEYIDRNI
jgi:hypothetical protein